MNIGIIGTGYVGLVTGACLSITSHTVYCVDVDEVKINNLNKGILPIYGPGLEELIEKSVSNKKIFFNTNYECIENCDAVMICVGTPQKQDGSADLQYIESAVEGIIYNIKKPIVIITKSTVPPGTHKMIKETADKCLNNANEDIKYYIVSNPEFLREGCAINDFMNPNKIVIGCDDEYGKIVMDSIYKSFNEDKLIYTSLSTAELIKYASNCMLATRISFMNELSLLCDEAGANIKDIQKAIGMDKRIGPNFLDAGCGYGGSCFPKDIKALLSFAKEHNINLNVISGTEQTNIIQRHILYKKLYNASKKTELSIKKIAILGTAFKPNTNDMRESPAITLINDLLNDDNKIGPFDEIKIYDPIALSECKRIIGESNEKIIYCDDKDNAILDADVVIIVTDWDIIKNTKLSLLKKLMNGNIIIDGRNIFNRKEAEELELIYEGIGT